MKSFNISQNPIKKKKNSDISTFTSIFNQQILCPEVLKHIYPFQFNKIILQLFAMYHYVSKKLLNKKIFQQKEFQFAFPCQCSLVKREI